MKICYIKECGTDTYLVRIQFPIYVYDSQSSSAVCKYLSNELSDDSYSEADLKKNTAPIILKAFEIMDQEDIKLTKRYFEKTVIVRRNRKYISSIDPKTVCNRGDFKICRWKDSWTGPTSVELRKSVTNKKENEVIKQIRKTFKYFNEKGLLEESVKFLFSEGKCFYQLGGLRFIFSSYNEHRVYSMITLLYTFKHKNIQL